MDARSHTPPDRLMAENQGLVHSLAWRIHRKVSEHVELDDLVGYGQIGLAEAARDFDSNRGVRFTTFAYHRIRGAILDGLSEMNWFKKSDYYRGQTSRLANEILHLQGLDRSNPNPTSQVGENAHWLREVSGTLAMVYLFCQQSDDDNSEIQVEDHSTAAPSAPVINREVKEKLHHFIDELPSEAAEFIRAAYFEGLSLKEAGERIGISKAWASRLHARTLAQLARAMRRADLD